MQAVKATTIDEYIACFPEEVQRKLEQMRATIKQAAPEAQEAIKYAIPAFIYKGNLVYFAAFNHHIGFYATPTGNEAFAEELSAYKIGKGSIQFPLDQPLPLQLISRIVKFRVEENLQKSKKKSRA
jgi:uncharacterized protein YdhG (YjbR/CyaY superfamily)